MSWLGSFGVLPSPNHVLAKLAIFRGAEPSPHSPHATDSAAVFYYYFKPFAAPPPPPPTPFSIQTPLVRQFHPLVLLTISAWHPLRIQPPSLATFPERTANNPLPRHRVSCLRAEMKISRLLAIETELLFHEVVDPPPSADLTLSFSFALGRMLYLHRKSLKLLLFFCSTTVFLYARN